LNEFGVIPDEKIILGRKTYSEDEAYSNMMQILKLPKKERPTAVFAPTDNMAWGVYRAAKELSISIPEDLALVGYGNLATSAQKGYQLSSIKQNGYEIGRQACEILLENITKPGFEQTNHHKILVSTELIVRDSSLENIDIH
jgi:DNA-binding LacI/PurR family transcriptional regulator